MEMLAGIGMVVFGTCLMIILFSFLIILNLQLREIISLIKTIKNIKIEEKEKNKSTKNILKG